MPGSSEAGQAHPVLHRAVELGVTLIDTAPLYGVSEDLVGEAFPAYPEGVVIGRVRRHPRRCSAEGIAFLPWRPLGHQPISDRGHRALERAAARLEATPRQIALAWLLGRSPVVCAIPGTSDIAHLEENVTAAELELSADERLDLDEAAAS